MEGKEHIPAHTHTHTHRKRVRTGILAVLLLYSAWRTAGLPAAAAAAVCILNWDHQLLAKGHGHLTSKSVTLLSTNTRLRVRLGTL